MKPFLKWAGNKYRIMEKIKAVLPEGHRLVEPFAGSLAVFMNTSYPSALLADVNPDLIRLYLYLRDEGEAFIRDCATLFVPENNTAEAYRALRAQFNETGDERRKALLFLYLNRHGYNGLCRYNARGGYNVPFGRYKSPYFPGGEMRAFAGKSKGAEIVCMGFEETMRQVVPGDVVYCDPPYVPLSPTASFSSYHAGGFDARQQTRLRDLAEELARKGIPVLLSNHRTSETDVLYAGAERTVFPVRRFISCNGGNRKPVDEVLALFR